MRRPERLLGREITRWINERYWQGNAELARILDLPLATYGYPVEPPVSPAAQPWCSPWLRWIAE